MEIVRPRHLLEVLEAGVGLEGLGDRSAAHFAEIVVTQAAETVLDESSAFKLSRTP